ncbi:MAG TPA: ROK family protein [Rhizomicrobium sp.]|nr:ROK family protein [Rhizomicrobium sp.]
MRLGVDLGGTKIEIIALDSGGHIRLRERVSTPRGYNAVLDAICGLVISAESKLGTRGTLGVAIPGALSARTGLVKNANSTALIGHPIDRDLAQRLGRQVRVANDANCFALSEATDGAAKDARVVFGIIAGTGIGGGICVGGRLIEGAHLIAGEWGHNPLPAPRPDEMTGAECYCGRRGCIETWISGPAIARQFAERTGRHLQAPEIARAAAEGDRAAVAAMEDFYDRFARAIGSLVNILDPDAIVLGGGLSNIAGLTEELPQRVQAYAFTPEIPTRIVRNLHGDSSGVRGAAWLWREDEMAGGS